MFGTLKSKLVKIHEIIDDGEKAKETVTKILKKLENERATLIESVTK